MEPGQAPKQTNDAQSLHALVDELKLVQSPSVLDSGAVLFNGAVLLLPKHRCCCAGSCHGVEPRDNKEFQETGENKHSLEGLWEASSKVLYFVYTHQAKPGYLFMRQLGGDKTAVNWFRSGNGEFKDVLKGKSRHPNSQWVEGTLNWYSNNSFKVVLAGGEESYSYVRVMEDLPVVD